MVKNEESMILPNGAKMFRRKESSTAGWSIIAAIWNDGDGKPEYVTWSMDDDTKECQSGHYFGGVTLDNYRECLNDFAKRS